MGLWAAAANHLRKNGLCQAFAQQRGHGSGAGKDGVTIGDQEPEIEPTQRGNSMGEKEAVLSGDCLCSGAQRPKIQVCPVGLQSIKLRGRSG